GWVCAEAMAAGRPVVCLDLGGPSTIVTGNAGYKVPAHSHTEAVRTLADAMTLLARDPARRERLGQAARARVAQSFTWEHRTERLNELYADAAAGMAGAP
ncbi:MAG: glycosyltransferase, partial [Chitinivibrionales bacterium]|nr:glycosyltransferase [Chitinivibrionales bacterium]MBD3397311.1 glycosyltransferase [Chitinivibrionales bacterium]